MFGYLTLAQGEGYELILPPPDSFLLFVVFPTNIWLAYRHSRTRRKNLYHDIWKEEGMPIIFQHVTWPFGNGSQQDGSILAMECLTSAEQEQARRLKDHSWIEGLMDSWTKVD